MCEGPVEGIISQLISSLSSTLHSQVLNTITSYVLSSPSPHHSQKQFPSLSSLPLIWKEALATQVIILVTQIALEISLNQALQAPKSLIDNLLKEISSLTSLAVSALRGKSHLEDDVTKPDSTNALQNHDLDDTTLKASTSDTQMEEGVISSTVVNEAHRTSRTYLVPRSHTKKMESIVMVLGSYRYKVKGLQSVLSSVHNVLSSFHWQSMFHYEWSAHDNQASVTTLGASLSYGYHYTGSATRLVLTPLLEKSMCFLLDAAKQGNSSLILGKEVSKLTTLKHGFNALSHQSTE